MPEGEITALRIQEHDNQRVNIFIDETFALGVSLDTLTREQLYVGKYLDSEQWARLEAAESADKAFHAALRLLQARPRSTAEMRQRLQRKHYAPDAIDSAIQRLTRLGMLDDVAFARFWVENRTSCRPRGLHMLRSELHQKGIDRDIIDGTLHDQELVGDEQTRAWTLAQAALPKYASITDEQIFRRRLGGYLQRRGFGYDTIKPMLDTLWHQVCDAERDEQN